MCVFLFLVFACTYIYFIITAALRTQPYDLLKWSATYFRCLQMGIPPPVKSRYERNAKHGSVTKEYLRVLIKQVSILYDAIIKYVHAYFHIT